VQGAKMAVASIETRLAEAHRRGDVSFLNREYRRRRIEAAANGESFLPYRAVQARLRDALGATIAGDMSTSLIERVFGRSP